MRCLFLGILFSLMAFSVAGGLAAGLVVVALTVAMRLTKKERWEHSALVYGALLMLAGGLLTTVFKGGGFGEDSFLREIYRLLLLFAVFQAFLARPSGIYFKLFALFISVHALFGTFQFFTGAQAPFSSTEPYSYRQIGSYFHAIGFFSHHQTFGGIMMMALPLFAAPVLDSRFSARQKAFFLAAACCALSGLLFSLTRGGWLGGLFGLTVLAALQKHRLLRWAGFAAITGFFVSVAFFALFSEPLQDERTNEEKNLTYDAIDELFDRATRFNPYRNGDRLAMWQAGWEVGRENWFLGVGTGDLSSLETTYRRIEAEKGLVFQHSPRVGVHNVYLQIWLDAGLLGLLGFLALFLGFFVSYHFVAKRKKFAEYELGCFLKGTVASVAAFAVLGFFENNFYDGEPQTVFLALLGAGTAMIHRVRRIKKERL